MEVSVIHRKEQNLSNFQPMPREQKDIGSIPGRIIRILVDGDLKQMNGCRIGAADGSYQKELLENGWTTIRFRQRLLSVKAMMK